MQKKRKSILAGYTILTILAITFLYTSTFNITGNVIYSDQPDPTSGKDTYLRESTDINYGTATTLKVGTASTAGGQEFKSLLYFNISSIPSDDTIVSAKLSVYLTSSATTSDITLNAYRLTSNWTEDEAGWYNNTATSFWSLEGGSYSSTIEGSQTLTDTIGWYNITITDLASDWITGTQDNYGLILYAPTAGIGDSKEIASSDYTTDSSLRPKLIIEHAENAPPQINEITTSSNSTSPIETGNDETFSLDWTDLEGDNAQLFICNSTSITTSGCDDLEFCSSSLGSTNPATCSYTTQTSDNKTTSFYAGICDSGNCTISSEQFFYINNVPTVSVIQPNGGETINQSQGNYSIQFSVSDADSDSLFANIYYGTTSGSTTFPINTNINLTTFCTDPDSDTSTSNTCVYPWNSSNIYGTFYLTILTNDTTSTATDSSDSSFNVRSIEDNSPPQITSTQITPQLHSGKQATINATITDTNNITAKIEFNYSTSNITMSQVNSTFFNATFLAPAAGTQQYKIHATDLLGNTNSSSWQTFTVSAPNATSLNITAPSLALPYSTIKVNSYLYANNSLRNIYAYLNVPNGFTFLTDYPQNAPLGNLSESETSQATWFLSVPITEGTYTLNTTYSDPYGNSWNSSNTQVQVTSSVGGGYTTTISGYPEVVKGNQYYVETSFLQSGIPTTPTSATITLINPIGFSSGELSLTEISTGNYNYNYSVSSAATEGIWQSIANFTYSGTSYIAQEFWKVLGTLFDVRDITIINAQIPDLGIEVTLENIGTAQSDMNLQWNLSREDTQEVLISGSDEIGVDPGETITHTIQPETSYVGQVRITFLGSYGEDHSQKAGAYKIFSTTSSTTTTPGTTTTSGGGGSGSSETTEATPQITSIKLSEIAPIVYLTKNIEKTISLNVQNNGTTTLTNIIPTLEGVSEENYVFSPSIITQLASEQETALDLKLTFTEETETSKSAILKLTSDQISITKTIQLILLTIDEYYAKELQTLKETIQALKNKAISLEALSTVQDKLSECEDLTQSTQASIENKDYETAQQNLNKAKTCTTQLQDKLTELENALIPPTLKNSLTWIITILLILVIIAAIIIALILVRRKMKLADFLTKNKNQQETSKPQKDEALQEKIRKLKEKIEKG